MILQRGYFTVPNDISDEKVTYFKEAYLTKYAENLEKDGWKLKSKIAFYKALPLIEDITQGRTRWEIKAYWQNTPVDQIFEVDEAIIPKLLETGKFSLA